MAPIYKTLQDRDTEPLGLLPWPYSHEPGQVFIVEYKRAGKVVRKDRWVLRRYKHPDGEIFRRWSNEQPR